MEQAWPCRRVWGWGMRMNRAQSSPVRYTQVNTGKLKRKPDTVSNSSGKWQVNCSTWHEAKHCLLQDDYIFSVEHANPLTSNEGNGGQWLMGLLQRSTRSRHARCERFTWLPATTENIGFNYILMASCRKTTDEDDLKLDLVALAMCEQWVECHASCNCDHRSGVRNLTGLTGCRSDHWSIVPFNCWQQFFSAFVTTPCPRSLWFQLKHSRMLLRRKWLGMIGRMGGFAFPVTQIIEILHESRDEKGTVHKMCYFYG